MSYNLNQTDKDFLYKKYIKLGCTPVEAYSNIKTLVESLKFYAEKLRFQKVSEEEINNKLRIRFENKCMEIEGKL